MISSSTAAPPAELAHTAAALRLAVGRLARRTRQEATFGHGLTRLGILATLHRAGPTTLGDLAAVEKVAPPTITKAVAGLADEGLVEKVTDPDDRRVQRAVLTPAGRQEVEEMHSRRTAWLAERMAHLSPRDVAGLVTAIPILEALAADDTGPP